MDNEMFLNSIKSLCKRDNISLAQLEKEINVSQGLISRWNKTDPSLSKVLDVANYFKVSLDELVKQNSISTDIFINKLITNTESNKIRWHPYKDNDKEPKKFSSEFMKAKYDGETGEGYYRFLLGQETSFYTPIREGYFSLYAYHERNNSKRFAVINLYIQADNDSDLIGQPYTTEQLIPLWLKVLHSLGKYAPDDIKAEELKNSFINDVDIPFSAKNFKNANLSGADFSGADLSRSNLSNANLEGAILNDIITEKNSV